MGFAASGRMFDYVCHVTLPFSRILHNFVVQRSPLKLTCYDFVNWQHRKVQLRVALENSKFHDKSYSECLDEKFSCNKGSIDSKIY